MELLNTSPKRPVWFQLPILLIFAYFGHCVGVQILHLGYIDQVIYYGVGIVVLLQL